MLRKILIFTIISKTILMRDPMFLIPHSHDDLGWKKTIIEYYNSTIRSIFTTTIQSLEKDKNRKFLYAETGFLKLYLEEEKEKKQIKIEKLKTLIKQNQFEFVNGGISQADTACPHHEDLRENLYYGISYLKRNLNTLSKGGWQIDPFGHSKSFSYLLSLFGMKDLVINRIGDDLKKKLVEDGNLSFKWVFPDEREIRVHVSTYEYDPPKGLDCDVRIQKSCDFGSFERFDTDWFFAEFNLKYTFAPWYFFGDDFYFANAENNFSFADQVIRIYDDLRYSLFSDYVAFVEKEVLKNKNLAKFKEDFFVYTQNDGSAWSGFYTSRPTLKLKIRDLGILLRSFKHFIIQGVIEKNSLINVEKYFDILEDFGYLLHHDTITGTSKKYVNEDYFKRINSIVERVFLEINKFYDSNFLLCDEKDDLIGNKDCEFKDIMEDEELFFSVFNPSGMYLDNKTVEIVFTKKINFKNFQITNEKGKNLKLGRWDCDGNKKCIYFFFDNFTPFAQKTYRISFKKKNSKENKKYLFLNLKKKILEKSKRIKKVNKNLSIDSNFDNYTISIENNEIIIKRKDKEEILNRISLWKISCKNSNHYILDYQGEPEMEKLEFLSNYKTKISKMNGYNIFSLITDNWKILINNKISNKNILDIKLVFKNLDFFKEHNFDLILKIKNPSIKNKGEIITDSNGYFTMTRKKKKKFEESVFPFTSYVKITDDNNSEISTGIFNDRAQGVVNDEEGSLMVYIQRTTTNPSFDEVLEIEKAFSVYLSVLNCESEEDWDLGYFYLVNEKDIHLFKGFFLKDDNFGNFKKNLIKDNLKNFDGFRKLNLDSGNKKLRNDNFNNNYRLNVDFVDEESFIIRLQNLNRKNILKISSEIFLNGFFGDLEFKEVNFDYGISENPETPKDVGNVVVLNPLEFKTFLAKIK